MSERMERIVQVRATTSLNVVALADVTAVAHVNKARAAAVN